MAEGAALSSLVGATSSAAGAFAQSQSLGVQGQYAQQQANFNAQIAELQADQAIKRGDKNANVLKGRAKQLRGAQRAAAAAGGVVVDDGSAKDLQEDTVRQSTIDAQEIRNNAWREAWGFKMAGLNSRYKGELDRLAAKNAANNTLITGGLNALEGVGKGAYYGNNAGWFGE